MRDRLKKILGSLIARFQSLGTAQRVGVVAFAMLLAGFVAVGIARQVQRDPFQVLYSELKSDDVKAVAKRLSDAKIPYRIGDDNATVLVPSKELHAARMQLAKEGLPGHDLVGFEKFDGSTLGMSSYVQRIQYVRAVQGELTRSIERLASVKSARVHISIPPKKTFLEETEPPKSSVILELRPGMSPTKTEVQGIAHLVASAVEGLQTNQVTIVDTKGNFLHRPENGTMHGMSTALLEMQRAIEIDYEKRIIELLTPVVGFDKVRAKVTAEIDPSRVNTTEETYDPEKAVAKTVIKNDEVTTGSRPNPIGIPGSRSNLPGTENMNPPIPMANTSTEKNVSNSNYAIPRKIQTTDKPSGNIKRLTVAVVVDGYYSKPVGDASPTFQPRPESELKHLQDIVANAVGFDSQRRDSLTVTSLPFQSVEIAEPKVEPTPIAPMPLHLKLLIAVLTMLVVGFGAVRPILKRRAEKRQRELEAAMAENKALQVKLPKTVAELEAEKTDALLKTSSLAGALAAGGDEEENTPEQKEQIDLLKKILERLEQAPKKGSRIVQEWLEKDEYEKQAA